MEASERFSTLKIEFFRNLKAEKLTNGSFWKIPALKIEFFPKFYKSGFDWWKLLDDYERSFPH